MRTGCHSQCRDSASATSYLPQSSLILQSSSSLIKASPIHIFFQSSTNNLPAPSSFSPHLLSSKHHRFTSLLNPQQTTYHLPPRKCSPTSSTRRSRRTRRRRRLRRLLLLPQTSHLCRLNTLIPKPSKSQKFVISRVWQGLTASCSTPKRHRFDGSRLKIRKYYQAGVSQGALRECRC